MTTSLRPVVADRTFILATRDTGYRSLAAAVGELIDNAVQAEATEVRVRVLEDYESPDTKGSTDGQVTIGVLDNGRGMDVDELWAALQFGGTHRFNDRSGLGRFGMGLPNSSVSVTRRLEVYSWRGWGQILHTYFDVDEITQGVLAGIQQPRYRPLPPWSTVLTSRSGTLVVWRRCDRLDYKRVATVAQKLRGPLGRMYRRLIWRGLRLWVNDEPVCAVDPLFCHPATGEGGARPYGQPLSYEISVPGRVEPSTVVIRFTELPVDQWESWSVEEKRAAGIVRGAGVSFVRAGREIDYGWELFGGKRRENYDDWWRCEIEFRPELDEHFGVTHSKQGVSPTPYIRSILESDLEATARKLNVRVRAAFEAIKRRTQSRAAHHATRQDDLLPPARSTTKTGSSRRGLRYGIALASIPSPHFFELAEKQGHVQVTINTDHPFYERLYLSETTDPGAHRRYALECMLLAAARAFLTLGEETGKNWGNRYHQAWSDALAAFLETKGPHA